MNNFCTSLGLGIQEHVKTTSEILEPNDRAELYIISKSYALGHFGLYEKLIHFQQLTCLVGQ